MKNEKNSHQIVVCVADEEIMATFPVMKQLRNIEKSSYLSRIKELMKQGYHLISYFKNDQCIGTAGYIDLQKSTHKNY